MITAEGEGATVEGTTTGEGREEDTAGLEVVDREEEDAVEESASTRTVEARPEAISVRTLQAVLVPKMGEMGTVEEGTWTGETIGTATGGGTTVTRATAGTTGATTATQEGHPHHPVAKEEALLSRWRSTLRLPLLLPPLPPPLQPLPLPALRPLPPMPPRRHLPQPRAFFPPPHLRHLPPKPHPLPLRPSRRHQHPNSALQPLLLHPSSHSLRWPPYNPPPSHLPLSTRLSTRQGTSELELRTGARFVFP